MISELVKLDENEHSSDGHYGGSSDVRTALRDATLAGNAAIARHVAEDPGLEGIGTTLTAMLLVGGFEEPERSRLGLVHIGNSRAYLLRDGIFVQITRDDTYVQSLIDEGRITEEEARTHSRTHPHRSRLTRSITGHDIDPTPTILQAREGDRYLLCSDGLSDVVSENSLVETLST